MTVFERQGAGAVTGNDGGATVRFWITGPTAWADAYNELYNASVGYDGVPPLPNYSNFNGIPAQSVNVDEVSERLGYWNGQVTYGWDTPRSTTPDGTNPELEISFDVSVRPRLERFLSDGPGWTQVGATIPAIGETAVDHDGIAYGGLEKGYEGVQVPRPETSFQLQYTPATLNQAQLKQIGDAVGKVNDATFYGYAIGEVLFAGASGQAKQNDRWRLSYSFLVKENRTNVSPGGGITFASVDGWDIVDVEHKRTVVSLPGPPAVEKTITRVRQARILRPFLRDNLATTIFPV